MDEVDEVGSTSWVGFGRSGTVEDDDDVFSDEEVVVGEGLSFIGFSAGGAIFGSESAARPGGRSAMTAEIVQLPERMECMTGAVFCLVCLYFVSNCTLGTFGFVTAFFLYPATVSLEPDSTLIQK